MAALVAGGRGKEQAGVGGVAAHGHAKCLPQRPYSTMVTHALDRFETVTERVPNA